MTALSPELDAMLQSFCRQKHVAICARPWTFSDGVRIYAGATDGFRALFVAGSESMTDESTEARYMLSLLKKKPPPTHEVGRADLLAAIGDGRAIDWIATECEVCDGDGETECDLGHCHPCHKCGGEGYVGGNRYSRDRIHGLHIDAAATSVVDAQLMRGVFDHLPGDPIQIGLGSNGVVYFEGAGWVFAIAGLSSPNPGKARGQIRVRSINQPKRASQ